MNERYVDHNQHPGDTVAEVEHWVIRPEPTPEEFAVLAAALVLVEQRMAGSAPSPSNPRVGKTAWQQVARQEALSGAPRGRVRFCTHVDGRRLT